MDASFLRGKRILMFQKRDWGFGIGRELARRLHAEGAVLAAITAKARTHNAVLSDPEPYEFVFNWDTLFADYGPIADASGLSLQDVCDGLGVKTVWPYVQALRLHVRSYGERYYYSFRQNINDEETRRYVIAEYAKLQELIERFQPDAIISVNFASLMHIMAGLIVNRRGAPMVAIGGSRVPGVVIGAWDPGQTRDRLTLRLAQGAAVMPGPEAVNMLADLKHGLAARRGSPARLRKSPGFVHFARQMVNSIIRRRYMPGIGPTVDWQPPHLTVRDFWKDHQNRRRALRRKYDQVPAGPFAFMGLQYQPEMTLDVISPAFNNQLETVRQVAMALPGDMTLVVKDHPSMMGLRRPSYLEKVARMPNVTLVDPRTDSVDLMERSECIIAVGGTMLGEAAWLGVPAIQIGPHGITRHLPNVDYCDDMRKLTDAVLAARRRRPLGGDEYESRLARFIQAVMDVGIDGYEVHYKPAEPQGFDPMWAWYVEELQAAMAEDWQAD